MWEPTQTPWHAQTTVQLARLPSLAYNISRALAAPLSLSLSLVRNIVGFFLAGGGAGEGAGRDSAMRRRASAVFLLAWLVAGVVKGT
jgi:hypothetical protein